MTNRDYTAFNASLVALDKELEASIDASFGRSCSINDSLILLKEYQQVLIRENMRRKLEAKLVSIYEAYGKELTRVQETYEMYRESPPMARNVAPVASSIMWARNLLKRIEEPMKTFQHYPVLSSLTDSKRTIKTYNKVRYIDNVTCLGCDTKSVY